MYMSYFFFSHKNRIIRQTLVTDIFIQQCAVSVSLWEARFLLAARVWQNSPQPSGAEASTRHGIHNVLLSYSFIIYLGPCWGFVAMQVFSHGGGSWD